MVGERDPKGIPMYRILASLEKKKEAKTITEISEEADTPYNAVRDNIYKLLAL
jgi:predicted transcriptional regulator